MTRIYDQHLDELDLRSSDYWLCENCESAYRDECRCPLCGAKEAIELTEEEVEELL